MPTPLPLTPFGSDPSSQPYLAYQKCCDLESLAYTDSDLQISRPPGVVAARLLGYLLVCSESGRETLAGEIIDAPDNATLLSMAQHYIIHFVKVFKRSSGRPPAPSDHPSPPSFEDECNALASINDPASLNHSKANIAALRRDGYRCPVTGLYDETTVRSGLVQFPAGVCMDNSTYTAAAHIIPESTNYCIDEDISKAHSSVGMWSVLSMFSSKPEELHEKLNGNEIHRLENIITLDQVTNIAFNVLSLWFRPVDDSPNTYTVHRQYGNHIRGRPLPKTITFTTTTRELQVPSPYYLELHALCCEVTNLSGVGEFVDLVEDELEEMEVLAGDGSSAKLLSFALSCTPVY